MHQDDWDRIEHIRQASGYDWSRTIPFHSKEDAGHEQPWTRFLAGENPGYPEDILKASYSTVCSRLTQIRADEKAETHRNVHHWQQTNPITTEGLVQLTTGAPQMIYNGGLPSTRVRYFDAERRRPGLPQDTAALVERIEGEQTTLRLVNLSPVHPREVIVQAGTFGEHRFSEVAYTVRTSVYPGPIGDYAAPDVQQATETAQVHDARLRVRLPPGMEITLHMGTQRYVDPPSYAAPW